MDSRTRFLEEVEEEEEEEEKCPVSTKVRSQMDPDIYDEEQERGKRERER